MFENTTPTTIFEVAPTKAGGERFYIHEIENPVGFFSGCDSPSDVLDRVVSKQHGCDEQIDTLGYTLVLDRPEDPLPDNAGNPPDDPISIEVQRGLEPDQRFSCVEIDRKNHRGNEPWDQPINFLETSFYSIQNPSELFSDAWGDSIEMFEAIQKRGLAPISKYDNVSFTFDRPYGTL